MPGMPTSSTMSPGGSARASRSASAPLAASVQTMPPDLSWEATTMRTEGSSSTTRTCGAASATSRRSAATRTGPSTGLCSHDVPGPDRPSGYAGRDAVAVREWHLEPEGAADADLAVDADLAAVLLDDGLGDREPEPGAGPGGRLGVVDLLEPPEQPAQRLVGDPQDRNSTRLNSS